MRTSIVRIGNSQGIRIPKVLLEQCHLGTDVELEVEDEATRYPLGILSSSGVG